MPSNLQQLGRLLKGERERAEAGWSPGPVKDFARKITPYLIPWVELSEEMREDLDLPADPWWRPRFRHARFKAGG